MQKQNFYLSEERLNDVEKPLLTPNILETQSRWWHFPKPWGLLQKVMAEAMGTFFLLFSVCGMAMVQKTGGAEDMSPLGQACVTAFSIILIVSAIGRISGAHINPAVTLSLAASRLFPWTLVPFYSFSQFLGATMGAWTAKILYNVNVEIVLTKPSGSHVQAFAMEFFISFHLMFLIAAVANFSESPKELNAMTVAAAVALNMVLGGPISGASMNPARSLGTAIVGNCYEGIWIYLVAPPIGGCAGAVVSRFLSNLDSHYLEMLSNSNTRITKL